MHEADRKRLGRGVAPTGEKDLPRVGVAYRLDQALGAFDAVAQPQARRGNSHLHVIAAVAQVASKRDLYAAANAEAADHRDHGLGRALQRMQRLVDQAVENRDLLRRRASRFELGDVHPHGKGLFAFAAQHDHAHLRVSLELRHRRRDCAPHGAVERVQAGRVVEHEPADRAVLLRPDCTGHVRAFPRPVRGGLRDRRWNSAPHADRAPRSARTRPGGGNRPAMR